ncbi:MAG TPA: hypothetical protein EYN15_00075 [Chromatiales bacterium]|nr:hypothetical protein [Chromatiales bacterium]
MLLQPDLPLITQAGFSLNKITPNADGDGDIALFSYSLSRNAEVSLAFESADGTQYTFREDEPRPAGDYEVLFSGVVDGYVLPGETVAGDVLRRLIPDGQYTWRLEAVEAEGGESEQRMGTLVVEEADSALPELSSFTISPDVFTPNQDGIDDRAQINVFLTKDADLTVYLEREDGDRIYIGERQEGRKPGEAGRHLFDYDGGVDLGADPPPDGSYTVVALTQDEEGQRVQRTATLSIVNGGDPRAEIAPQAVGVDVVFDAQPYDDRYLSSRERPGVLIAAPDDPQDLSLTALTIPVGDVLVFKLTVENYSTVPIRTTGPPPGTVYRQDQRAATLGWFDESGAWRVGIDCTTAPSDYPWRWALGSDDNLMTEVDPLSGNLYRYLPPGEQVVVWGAIRMTDIEARNPQNCWAGLIHEDVEVSIRNSRVGAREIELVDPAG